MAALIVVAFGNEIEVFLIEVRPVVAPIVREVAAFPKVKVLAFVSKIEAFEEVVEIVPPFTATFPLVEISPEVPLMLKFVARTLPVPSDKALVIFAPEMSIAVVMPPVADEILKAVGKAWSVSALLINTNSLGSSVPLPSALTNLDSPVDPVAVVTVKLELVEVLSRVKEMSLLLVVVMVLPPV